MASNINPNNVDGTFPVAGQDNSSQGFRDNFTNIKNNFLFAAAEISDLQAKAVTTAPLAGQTITNDFAGTQIYRPQLKAWTESFLDQGAGSGPVILDFNAGNFQKVTTAGPVSVSFANWPATQGTGAAIGYGVLRLWLSVTLQSHTLQLPASVLYGALDIAGYDPNSNTITFDTAGDFVFDFSSIDGGQTYFMSDVRRNHATFRDPSFYFNSTVNPTILIGYGQSGLTAALNLEQGQDRVSALGSYNSVFVGNMSVANLQTLQGDTGGIAGYSVTGLRGNIVTLSQSPTQTGDIIGYYNGIGYTGTTASQTSLGYTQTSNMMFYAVGNTSGSLGGNIAFYTKPDATASNTLLQAMSINNDQTVEVMGALRTDGAIIENGTQWATSTPTGGGSITIGSNVSTVIIDSATSVISGTVAITLPSAPKNGQRVRIASAATVTTTTVSGGSNAVRYATSSMLSTGNVAVSFTYNATASTWYRS